MNLAFRAVDSRQVSVLYLTLLSLANYMKQTSFYIWLLSIFLIKIVQHVLYKLIQIMKLLRLKLCNENVE